MWTTKTKDLKQVIMIRKDLKLPKGKACAQAAHASCEALMQAPKKLVKAWRTTGMKKIVVAVSSLEELRSIITLARSKALATSLITDAGKTVVAPGTTTAGAVGPCAEGVVDELTADLSLY